jgi:hypothetical protein
MDACPKQRLVGVDVSQSCQKRLIEQGILDGALRLRETHHELAWSQGQRLGTEAPVAAIASEPPDAPEAARIAEAQLCLRPCNKGDQMRVARNRRPSRLDRQPPAHPQVHIKTVGIIQ